MRHIHIGISIPVVGQFIAQLDVTAILFKGHVFTMPVGPVVRTAKDAGETFFADAVSQFRFQRIVRTVAGM